MWPRNPSSDVQTPVDRSSTCCGWPSAWGVWATRVDILTRRFEGQAANRPPGDSRVRVVRIPSGRGEFVPQGMDRPLDPRVGRECRDRRSPRSAKYGFISSHYWDAGVAGMYCRSVWDAPCPHAALAGWWKRDSMDGDRRNSKGSTTSATTVRNNERSTPAQTRGRDHAPAAGVLSQWPVHGRAGRRDGTAWLRRQPFLPRVLASREAIQRELGLAGPLLALGRLAGNKGYDLLLTSLPPCSTHPGCAPCSWRWARRPRLPG